MARKRSQAKSPFDTESTTADIFDATLDAAKHQFPEGIYVGTEAAKLLICLPVPSLIIRYLLQQEGWPLSRFTMVVGEPLSSKSAFLYEVIRWHRMAQGKGVIFDTEWKPAPDLLWSINNWDFNACIYQMTKTMEAWNEALNWWIQELQTAMDGTGGQTGRGRLQPACFGIDSLLGTLNQKEQNRIESEGTPEKHFAVMAGLLTDYMRVMPKRLTGYPFSVIGVNHLKMGQTQSGLPDRKVGGGYALKFHQATEIQMNRKTSLNPTSKTQIHRIENDNVVEGVELMMSTFKNSNAPMRKISVEMLWYTDYSREMTKYVISEGQRHPVKFYPQITYFDWETATVEFLANLAKEKTRQARLVRELLDVKVMSTSRRAWCEQIGVPEKERMPYRELGFLIEKKLQEDQSLRDELYPVLGIIRRHMWRPNVDFRELQEEAKELGLVADQESVGE